jgi:branched-chain amino acid transport system ATP-binding protein
MALLEVKDVHTFYGNIEALKGISIEVQEGECVTLIGSNGAGKSTTLRSISGLTPPRQGSIRFQDREISETPPQEIVSMGVALSPEGRHVFPRMTVFENLMLGAYLRRDESGINDDLERVYSLFPRLKERERQKGGTMSGGEQQMLAMSRALASDPALLLLDELSMGLAPLIVDELYETVAQIAQSGVSILCIEQFARTALRVADYAAVMTGGRIVATGEPEEIMATMSDVILGGAA